MPIIHTKCVLGFPMLIDSRHARFATDRDKLARAARHGPGQGQGQGKVACADGEATSCRTGPEGTVHATPICLITTRPASLPAAAIRRGSGSSIGSRDSLNVPQ